MAKVTLLNKGPRTYHTKAGILEANATLEVEDHEAKELLQYRDITKLKTESNEAAKSTSAHEHDAKTKGDTPAKSGKK